MNIFETIQTRRSTRKFLNKPVEEAKLHQIIEAGRHAPSGGNNQSTHIIVVENKEVLENLATMVRSAFSNMEVYPSMYKSMANSVNASKKGNYIFHYNAPILILCANKLDYSNNIADVSCVMENMMIMANSLDLGSCWINQLKWLNEESAINAYLYSLGMEIDERVYGAVAIGYPDTEDGLPNRTPLKRTGNKVTYIK